MAYLTVVAMDVIVCVGAYSFISDRIGRITEEGSLFEESLKTIVKCPITEIRQWKAYTSFPHVARSAVIFLLPASTRFITCASTYFVGE